MANQQQYDFQLLIIHIKLRAWNFQLLSLKPSLAEWPNLQEFILGPNQLNKTGTIKTFKFIRPGSDLINIQGQEQEFR